ncbi:Ger(x)C family spore germination protein [Paenibacillus sp. HB172176]|uniref:Ger(x)C family spore germination protein n=1 Tax=Paenibacillus sp. HB172176 TaxID=2493690 RepID=UPI0014398893|nr:Ger(x)C family spore germination protein [Paenibacillus sp. HB172176]
MKKHASLRCCMSFLLLSLMTGCWDNYELDQFGYVQAVAADQGKEGKVKLTTHFYNPTSKMEKSGASTGSHKGINIQTTGDTLFEAVRDIPMYFGRKAKWDHMRVILLGEELIKDQDIGEILDYLSRDHEPRGTVLPLISEGPASSYLDIKPFIEETIGQQFKKMETQGAQYAAKTSKTPLYDFAIQLKSASKVAVLPYIHKRGKEAVISGIVLIKHGRLAYVLDSKNTETFQMLNNRYKEGVIEFRCMGDAEDDTQTQHKETFEVITFHTELTPRIQHDKVTVDIDILAKGNVGELRCSTLLTVKNLDAFEEKIEEEIRGKLERTLSILQKNHLDGIGIGNQIYRKNPKLWKQWEPTWEKRFAECQFNINVDVEVLNTGMNVGTPFGKEKGEQ